MNELKKGLLPLVLIVISGAFLAVSLIVLLRGNKSGKWISRKMKLGGLILSLTALINACDPAQTAALTDGNPPWTCYIIAMPDSTEQKKQNIFYVETNNDSLITLNRRRENQIKGEIRNRTYETFSFAVIDQQGNKLQCDNILASDGVFDERIESFSIDVDQKLPNGLYIIRFFESAKENQPEWSEQYFNLRLN